jgi:hypothetical protein
MDDTAGMARIGMKRRIESVPKKPSHPTAINGEIEYRATIISVSKCELPDDYRTLPIIFSNEDIIIRSTYIGHQLRHTFNDKLGSSAKEGCKKRENVFGIKEHSELTKFGRTIQRKSLGTDRYR